jgi:DNA-binding LacI/PurR family transcriptional regulator
MAAEHLVQQGYQNIGAITGDLQYLVTQERCEGFEDALKKHGKSFTPRQIVEGDWTSGSGVQSFHTLVQQFPGIDAVFVHNDRMALGVLAAAHDLGWSVPDRLGVVGFDNLPESSVSIPRLTTIRNPLEEIGRAAAEHLDQILREPADSEKHDSKVFRLVIKPEIISRASSVRREG